VTNTNGAQLEIIDGGPPKPLNADEAKALDEKIRDASRKLATDADVLLSLLERAKAGQIHDALDFPSWPA